MSSTIEQPGLVSMDSGYVLQPEDTASVRLSWARLLIANSRTRSQQSNSQSQCLKAKQEAYNEIGIRGGSGSAGLYVKQLRAYSIGCTGSS